MDVASIIAKVQEKRASSIPEQWRLSKEHINTYTRPIDIVKQAGILSEQDLEITEQNATELLQKIHSGSLTSVTVTEAFLKRAALAHQAANCLTEFFPDHALATARALDDHFRQTANPIGPLHGLPIAIKDMNDLKNHLTTLAIIFAKTTMPQTGMALETNSNLWGRTLNAYNVRFGSGGSSGGDGALVGLRGAPAAPLASDIGGGTRAPAAFNGLYALRPTAERIPRDGLRSTISGQHSIKISCGPIAHSMKDLKLFAKLILTRPSLPIEGGRRPGYWKEPPRPMQRLKIGLMSTDGVVQPHPPIARALKESADKLKAAGHEVLDYKLPFDAGGAALTTFGLYWQTGAAEAEAAIAASGEEPIVSYAKYLDIYQPKALTTKEVDKLKHIMHHQYKFACAVQRLHLPQSRPFDAILCPVSPAASVPHDFPVYWGYTSLWNLVDFPSIVIPVKDLVIDPVKDKKDPGYRPADNPFDRDNWAIYEPAAWQDQPVTLQVVGNFCDDEMLIAVSECIDEVINGSIQHEQEATTESQKALMTPSTLAFRGIQE